MNHPYGPDDAPLVVIRDGSMFLNDKPFPLLAHLDGGLIVRPLAPGVNGITFEAVIGAFESDSSLRFNDSRAVYRTQTQHVQVVPDWCCLAIIWCLSVIAGALTLMAVRG